MTPARQRPPAPASIAPFAPWLGPAGPRPPWRVPVVVRRTLARRRRPRSARCQGTHDSPSTVGWPLSLYSCTCPPPLLHSCVHLRVLLLCAFVNVFDGGAVVEAGNRGSLTFGLYRNTRSNVFAGDGEVRHLRRMGLFLCTSAARSFGNDLKSVKASYGRSNGYLSVLDSAGKAEPCARM